MCLCMYHSVMIIYSRSTYQMENVNGMYDRLKKQHTNWSYNLYCMYCFTVYCLCCLDANVVYLKEAKQTLDIYFLLFQGWFFLPALYGCRYLISKRAMFIYLILFQGLLHVLYGCIYMFDT